jgi:hypothetical protein
MPQPIRQSALGLDLSPRLFQSSTVVASPALAAETIIASITVTSDPTFTVGAVLLGWAAFTVGTSGTACNMRLRATNVSGTVIAATGATTGGIAAANLVDMNAQGVDAAPPAQQQVYVLTLQVTAGAAASTVSAVSLVCLCV